MNRRIVKLGLVVVLPLLALPMLLGLECYTSDVFKTGGGSDTIPDGGERVLWTFDANTSPEPMESPVMYSSPAIASDGTIYIGSYDNYIYAIDIEGNRTWGFKTGGDVLTSPAVGPDGSVYVGSADDFLYAFESGGSQKWKVSAEGAEVGSVAIGSDGTVYFVTDGGYSADSYFFSVTPQGDTNWRIPCSGSTKSPAIASDGTIYLVSDYGVVYAFSPYGEKKWEYEACSGADGGVDTRVTPAVGSDGVIYFGTLSCESFAINPDGSLAWSVDLGSSKGVRNSANIASDGTVLVGTHDSILYALKGSSNGLASSSWSKYNHDQHNTGRQGG